MDELKTYFKGSTSLFFSIKELISENQPFFSLIFYSVLVLYPLSQMGSEQQMRASQSLRLGIYTPPQQNKKGRFRSHPLIDPEFVLSDLNRYAAGLLPNYSGVHSFSLKISSVDRWRPMTVDFSAKSKSEQELRSFFEAIMSTIHKDHEKEYSRNLEILINMRVRLQKEADWVMSVEKDYRGILKKVTASSQKIDPGTLNKLEKFGFGKNTLLTASDRIEKINEKIENIDIVSSSRFLRRTEIHPIYLVMPEQAPGTLFHRIFSILVIAFLLALGGCFVLANFARSIEGIRSLRKRCSGFANPEKYGIKNGGPL